MGDGGSVLSRGFALWARLAGRWKQLWLSKSDGTGAGRDGCAAQNN